MRGSPLLLVLFVLVPPYLSHAIAVATGDGRQAAQHELLLPGTSRSHLITRRRRRRRAGCRSNKGATATAATTTTTTTTTTTETFPNAATAVRSVRGGGTGATAAPITFLKPSPKTTTTTTAAAALAETSECSSSSSSSSSSNSSNNGGGRRHTARVLGYFALWYALNVWYNIVNKKVLNALALPASVAVAQLGVGSLWVGTQWLLGLRTRPGKLTTAGARRLTPVAFFHGGGQLATVLSLGAGAVSFTHVVKAMEPFFSALVAAVWFRQVFRWQVYASLLPVVAGVALACAKEINFSWVSFLAAMTSNLLFACRANFSKALMTRPPIRDGASISSANLYGLVTLTAFVVFAPVAVLTGWKAWGPAWELALKNGHQSKTLALSVVMSGISHYLNNEVMYLALGSVHPTTLAVGNTMKRVFIVVASLIVFKTPISKLGMVGSAVAVGGVLVYSLTKQYYDALDRKKVAED